MYVPPPAVTSFLRFNFILFILNLLSLCLAFAMPIDGYEGLSSFIFIGAKRSISNLQTFTSALGGIGAPAITMSTDSTRPYEVDGDTFPDFPTAGGRSCDVQYNSCADAANAKQGNFTVSDCGTQQSKFVLASRERSDEAKWETAQCNVAQDNAMVQSFSLEDLGPDPDDPEFELYCEP